MRLSLVFILTLIVFGAVVYGLWRRRGAPDGDADDALAKRVEPPAIPAPAAPAALQAPTPVAIGAGDVAAAPADGDAAAELARGQAADRAATRRALHELAFGVGQVGPFPPREHAPVVNAVLAALEDAASQAKYMPRRPSIVPQLLQAMNDSQASRREIAAIISRDPTLAADLLKLANGAFYRVSTMPVESIDRAVAVLGTDGIRSLLSAALLQPMFRMPAGPFQRFPQVAWDQATASAVASESLAALAESDDPFAAQLLALLVGGGGIVVFRVVLDTYASEPALRPSPEAIAMLIDRQAAPVARRIAASWELSERMIGALNDQGAADAAPLALLSPLGRSLLLGRELGALGLLAREGAIPEAEARERALRCGAPPRLVERIWVRLAQVG
jgi:HD-like signal output (HDOD) protein